MKSKLLIGFLALTSGLLAVYILSSQSDLILLNPAGIIAAQERDLLVFTVLLGLVIIVPVVLLLYLTAYRFRSTNKKATYMPDWHLTPLHQGLLWLIPTIFIVIIAVVTWNSTHQLEPNKSPDSSKKPLTIQVVALRWKWLFIYPEQNIATVNYVVFPEKTPIEFKLTADAPMSSFWIPHLGGQLYAMEGMVNTLYLMADKTGEFPGSNAEITGDGFAGMRFVAKATTNDDFTSWVASVKQTETTLSESAYEELVLPSERVPERSYASVTAGLYNDIVMKYMNPALVPTMPVTHSSHTTQH